ncbi:hypothetical protein [Comamonas antarctica]|uniref:hypothetical protein n=1 Tax=Comamonas antarctica TaxID=2743470 RepID=UPI0028EB3048|nr:hypothetical protein [Comamonas antarctica]
MKVQSIQPLLCLSVTDLPGMGDLTVILEAPERRDSAAQLTVRSNGRTWNAVLYCGDKDPIDYLVNISTGRLRDDLEFSRPASRYDCDLMKRMTLDLAQVIPHAVAAHAANLQPAPAGDPL